MIAAQCSSVVVMADAAGGVDVAGRAALREGGGERARTLSGSRSRPLARLASER